MSSPEPNIPPISSSDPIWGTRGQPSGTLGAVGHIDRHVDIGVYLQWLKSVATDHSNLSTLSVGTTDHFGTTDAKVVRIEDSGTTSTGSDSQAVRVESARTVSTSPGGEHSTILALSTPVLDQQVAGHYGIVVAGFPTGSAAPTEQQAVRIHWDSQPSITTPLHSGIYSHVGAVGSGSVITEARCLELESGVLFGGDIGKSVAIRINDLYGATQWSLLSNVTTAHMHHLGKVHVGGSTIETVPTARLQVTETTSGNEIFRKTTLADVGHDPILRREFQAYVDTTDATPAAIWSKAISGSKAWMVTAEVVARNTAGGPGGENTAGYVRRALIENVFGSAVAVNSTSDFTAESQSGWDCYIDTSGANFRVMVQGASATTIRWHVHITLMEVGS